MRRAPRTRYSHVDAANAVDWDHPLNRGRVLWLYGAPGTQAGAGGVWPDLTGRTPGGSLTSGAKWGSGRVPRLALTLGATGYVSGWAAVSTAGDVTAAAWVNPTTNGGTNNDIFGFYLASGAFTGWGLSRRPGTGLAFWDGTAMRDSSVDWTLNAWQHVAVAAGATSGTIYLNGRPVASISPAARGAFTGAKSVGARSDGGNPLTGQLDDAGVWSRRLTDAEIADVYRLSLAGYQTPDSPLRWVGTRSYFVGGGAVNRVFAFDFV